MTQTLSLTPSSDPLDLEPFVGGSPLIITGTVPATPAIAVWTMELWKYSHSASVEDAEPIANASGSVTAGVLTIAFAAAAMDMELSAQIGANNYWLIISGHDANGLRQIIRQGTIEVEPGYISTQVPASTSLITVTDDVATFVYDGTTYSLPVVAATTPDGSTNGDITVVDDVLIVTVGGTSYSTAVAPAPDSVVSHETSVLDLTVVQNAAQLTAALAVGGTIHVYSNITLTETAVISVDGTKLLGMGADAALIYPHTTGGPGRNILSIAAANCVVSDLELTANHPLTSERDTADAGWAIILSATDGVDVSGGVIERCRIHHVGGGIRRNGAAGEFTEKFSIVNNHIYSLWWYAIYLNWNCKGFTIERNRMRGVSDGDTHTNKGNAIWIGNNADYAQIHNNTISHFGRHGIEYWNSQTEALTTNGNLNGKITSNTIFGMLGVGGTIDGVAISSFGISAFGNGALNISDNSVSDCVIGIEVYNDPINKSSILINANTVHNIASQGFSINNTKNCKVTNNIIGECVPHDTVGGLAMGMQIIYGAENLLIAHNQFRNSGQRAILLHGRARVISNIESSSADATFTVTVAFLAADNNPEFIVGRRIYIRSVSGVTNGSLTVNNRYYTITWISTDRTQFRCGFSSVGYTAYTSGGQVEQAFNNIVIDNNAIHYTENPTPNGASFQSAVWLYYFQRATLRRNIYWKTTGVAVDGFTFSNTGSLYVDETGTPITAAGTITGTNLTIESINNPEF